MDSALHVQTWHLWADDSGQMDPHGGRHLSVGVGIDGRIMLAVDGAEPFPMNADTTLKLAEFATRAARVVGTAQDDFTADPHYDRDAAYAAGDDWPRDYRERDE